METVIYIIALIVMAVGALGTFLPVIPGTPVILVTAFVYAIYDNFNDWVGTIIVMAVLTAVSMVIDYYSGIWGAKKYGGSRWGIWGAVIGLVLGLFWMPLGLILGPLVGAVAAEILAGKEMNEAFRVGWGTLVGFLGGSVLKFIIAVIMIIVFVLH